MDTIDVLHETSDELLKACNITAGQIVRIKKALRGLASITPSESESRQAEQPDSDRDVVIRMVSDFSEMQEINFDTEIMPAIREIVVPTTDDDEDLTMPQSSDPSPPVAFTTEDVKPDEKWLSSFELPKKVHEEFMQISEIISTEKCSYCPGASGSKIG